MDVMEFMRRFFQHVLPTGFMKVRYYGFLSPTCRVPLEHIRTLIELAYGFEVTQNEIEPQQPLPRPTCGSCLSQGSFCCTAASAPGAGGIAFVAGSDLLKCLSHTCDSAGIIRAGNAPARPGAGARCSFEHRRVKRIAEILR